MKDGLYHHKVFWPFSDFRPVFSLSYSNHAIFRANELNIELPRHFLPRVADVFEVEVKDGKIFKIAARQKLGDGRCVCYPFNYEEGFVRTVWMNLESDKHHTLDKNRYVRS